MYLLPLSTFSMLYGQFHKITDVPWHKQAPNWLPLKAWSSMQQVSVKNTCVKKVIKKPVGRARRDPSLQNGNGGNLKWILKPFVWFCFVEDTLEGGFPSVLLSPWPLSANLSHLSSCYWTSPLRPCQRPQRARPDHQSQRRRATPITESSHQWCPKIQVPLTQISANKDASQWLNKKQL